MAIQKLYEVLPYLLTNNIVYQNQNKKIHSLITKNFKEYNSFLKSKFGLVIERFHKIGLPDIYKINIVNVNEQPLIDKLTTKEGNALLLLTQAQLESVEVGETFSQKQLAEDVFDLFESNFNQKISKNEEYDFKNIIEHLLKNDKQLKEVERDSFSGNRLLEKINIKPIPTIRMLKATQRAELNRRILLEKYISDDEDHALFSYAMSNKELLLSDFENLHDDFYENGYQLIFSESVIMLADIGKNLSFPNIGLTEDRLAVEVISKSAGNLSSEELISIVERSSYYHDTSLSDTKAETVAKNIYNKIQEYDLFNQKNILKITKG